MTNAAAAPTAELERRGNSQVLSRLHSPQVATVAGVVLRLLEGEGEDGNPAALQLRVIPAQVCVGFRQMSETEQRQDKSKSIILR